MDVPAGHRHVPLRGSPLLCCLPQVQGFLEVAGQAPDLVERYCGLYQRLRGATEELFGQQAALMLALGQGFAGALLQLSFLTTLHVSQGSTAPVPDSSVTSPWHRLGRLSWPTALGELWVGGVLAPQSSHGAEPCGGPGQHPAVGACILSWAGACPALAPAQEPQGFLAAPPRDIFPAWPWSPVSPLCTSPVPLQVSEQFARYLDRQIQELQGAAGSVGSVQQLQQILEPFVVFSGLELAHTFEHFYR